MEHYNAKRGFFMELASGVVDNEQGLPIILH